ncbi:MAG: D-glycerate dehydrogenase [Dehalococcoidia bacterium]
MTTQQPRVYVTRKLTGDALGRLSVSARVAIWDGEDAPPYDVLAGEAAGSEALVTLLTDRIDAELLGGSPRLRVVANVATGYDNIDLDAATRLGIAVTNTPGILEETTADLAFALLLASARRVAEGDRLVRNGGWTSWSPTLLLGRDVHGATLGIVGLGKIGSAVARRALGFGMRVIYFSRRCHSATETELGVMLRPVNYRPLDELLSQSDFVSIHLPLTAETRGLIGRRELALMKPQAHLINTSRGPLVDQAALYEALAEGRLGGGGLDVYEEEPLPADSPLISLPNVVLTPHLGSATVVTRERMADVAVTDCLRALRGERPTNCLNPEVFAKAAVAV